MLTINTIAFLEKYKFHKNLIHETYNVSTFVQFNLLLVSKWTNFIEIWITSTHHFIGIGNIEEMTRKS